MHSQTGHSQEEPSQTEPSPGALASYRIIDLTTILMAPLATRMLGDHGADIVRVETLTGDSTRNSLPTRHTGMSGFSLNLQRNKRSLSIDLKTTQGKQVVERLIPTADVLVTNMRHTALERLGLDSDSVRKLNPRLIYCLANGYGHSGPYRDRPAYDDVIQAASGISNLIDRATGQPGYVPGVMADKVVGLHIVQAVMAALLHRERTGEAQTIEVPMFETMVAFNLVEHHRGATYEPPLGPFGYPRLLSPHRRPMKTADGVMCLLPYTDANFKAFFEFAGQPELVDDPRFRLHNDRIANSDELYELIDGLATTHTNAEWLEFCEQVSIPAAAVLDLAELDNDPHLAAVGLVQVMDHPSEGTYRYVHDAVNYSATPTGLHHHAPRLGEHSAELLGELGYSQAETTELVKAGVVAV